MKFSEADVGIELYLADVISKQMEGESGSQLNTQPIRCAFKHRFGDFIVNEIDTSGEVVWFKAEENLQKWKKANMAQTMPAAAEVQEEEKKEEDSTKGDGVSLYPETWEKLKELLSEEDYNLFKAHVDGIKDGSVARDKWLVLGEEFSEKERRASIHSFFKESVKLYETDTIV